MLSEEEKKAIEKLKKIKKDTKIANECGLSNNDFKEEIKVYDTVLNLITKLQKEVEHQKEKRENQKTELAILNEKQKEMNKLKNTVSSYCGMFRKQEREIRKLQKENKELNKKIYLCTPEIPQSNHGKYVSYVDLINKIIEKDKQIDLMTEKLTTSVNNKKWIKLYYQELAKEQNNVAK